MYWPLPANLELAGGAGIWGSDDVTAAAGEIIVFTGAGEGAAGYEVS